MKKKEHIVKKVAPGSIAEEMEIEPGDKIIAIDNTEIEDIFDYQFLVQDTYIEVLVEKPDGEQWVLEIDKEFDQDLGIEFENGLMDEYRHCHNKCIFCFIDQMPKGMRETLYFKDDDSRLSFLQGNYVTLTNMSEHDIDRIIRYHLSPINISFQTMNPELRCKMLNNRFAGEALKKVDKLYEGEVEMNGQIVLCKGVNDGKELEYSIKELRKYRPYLKSVSVVPVGLSKYREGLYPLEPFDKKGAEETIDLIEKYQRLCYEEDGNHFIHASDEWYILAEREVPEEERYDGYQQLENGVGMVRLLLNEFEEALARAKESALTNARGIPEGFGNAPLDSFKGDAIWNTQPKDEPKGEGLKSDLSYDPWKDPLNEMAMATGKLMFPYIKRMAQAMMETFPWLKIHVYEITNVFFGERITVSGLLTGQDLRDQLLTRELGARVLLPVNVLRIGEQVFLDDLTLQDLENALQLPVNIVKSSGQDFVNTVLRRS